MKRGHVLLRLSVEQYSRAGSSLKLQNQFVASLSLVLAHAVGYRFALKLDTRAKDVVVPRLHGLSNSFTINAFCYLGILCLWLVSLVLAGSNHVLVSEGGSSI